MDFVKKQNVRKKSSFTDAVKEMDEKGNKQKELPTPLKKMNNDKSENKLFHDHNIY